MTNTELKLKAFQILQKNLGIVEMEKFIALVQQEKYDYTKWRENLFSNMDIEKTSRLAMEYREKLKKE